MSNNMSLTPRGFWSFPSLDMWENDFDFLPRTMETANKGMTISEDDKNFYVEAAVPGVNPDDLEVTIDNNMLWVRGATTHEEKRKDKKYYQKAASSFSYRLSLPREIDQSAEPEAYCENGMIYITMPKSHKSQPKRISLKTGKTKQKVGNGMTKKSVDIRQTMAA